MNQAKTPLSGMFNDVGSWANEPRVRCYLGYRGRTVKDAHCAVISMAWRLE